MGAAGRREGACGKRCVDEPFDDDFKIADDGFLDGLNNKQIGALGEDIAAAYLERLGYEVVERNYRCPEGEADLIVYDASQDEVVLVEVKTRRQRNWDEGLYPEEAVSPKKRRRYRRIASHYAMESFPVPCIRFDVVAIGLVSGTEAGILHLERAFDWDVDR